MKEKHSDNLIAIYGVGSYFDDALPLNWIKNDIDIILIVKSIDKIPKEVWNNRFKTKKINGQDLFTGFNTIESYYNKAEFSKISGVNYEWSLICLKHPENSILLYGEDIRNQIPDTVTITCWYNFYLTHYRP